MKINTQHHPKIVVVGSCSVDLVLNTNMHPAPNETVMAESCENFFGGKGANQAVAAARLGANVYFIGSIGQDPYGQQIMRNLVEENINVGFVAEKSEKETGTAFVTAANGKTSIVVFPSANEALSPSNIDDAEKILSQADMVLTQLEIPMHTVEYLIRKCKDWGVKIGIYAAPAKPLAVDLIEYASFIVAKNNDIPLVFAHSNKEQTLKKLANKLFVRDDTNSTLYYNGEEMKYFRNDPQETAYKMGMGDAFTAGFAIAMCHENSIEDCVIFGNDVSKNVAANMGSQGGLPYLSDLI